MLRRLASTIRSGLVRRCSQETKTPSLLRKLGQHMESDGGKGDKWLLVAAGSFGGFVVGLYMMENRRLEKTVAAQIESSAITAKTALSAAHINANVQHIDTKAAVEAIAQSFAQNSCDLHRFYGIPSRKEFEEVAGEWNSRQSTSSVTLIVGPQGSGKTETAKALCQSRRSAVYIPLRGHLQNTSTKAFTLHCLEQLGVPITRPGHRTSYERDIPLEYVNILKQGFAEVKKQHGTVPLLVIDNVQQCLINGALPEETKQFFGSLIDMQQDGLVEVLLIASDTRVTSPLLAISGAQRVDVRNVSWLPKERLLAPYQEFIGCSKEAATRIVESIGGNLKELKAVREVLYEVLLKKHASFVTVELPGDGDAPLQYPLKVNVLTPPPGTQHNWRFPSVSDVDEALEIRLRLLRERVVSQIATKPYEQAANAHFMLDVLLKCETRSLSRRYSTEPCYLTKAATHGMNPQDWARTADELVEANILRYGAAGELLWYQPALAVALCGSALVNIAQYEQSPNALLRQDKIAPF